MTISSALKSLEMNPIWIRYLPGFIRSRLQGRQDIQVIVSNTGWLFADKVVRFGVALIVGFWIARYLGPEQFGLLNYATAFVVMFSPLATLGLDGIVVRDIVRDHSRKEIILGTAFLLKGVCGVVSCLITLFVIIVLRPHESLTHSLVGIIAVGTVFQAFDIIEFWFQAIVQSKYTVYAKNGAYLLVSVVKICLILVHAPLVAFAWSALAEAIIGSVGLIVVYRMNGERLRSWGTDFTYAKRLLKDSLPIMFSGTFVLITMIIDKIMLGDLASNSEVGLYSAAGRLSEIWYFIPVIVGSSLMPSLVRLKEASESDYNSKLQQIYNFMTLTAISLALPITFLSPMIIAVFYGPGYEDSAQMLSIHIWTALFVSHVSIRTVSLIIEGKQRFITVMAFFTMVSNVVFNLFLIPAYGGVGASYASLFSWMLCVFLVPLLSYQTSESVKMFIKSLYLWIPMRKAT